MINKKCVTLSFSFLLLQPLLLLAADAQSDNTQTPKTDSEAWPWMDAAPASKQIPSTTPSSNSMPNSGSGAGLDLKPTSKDNKAFGSASKSLQKESAASAATASFAPREVPKFSSEKPQTAGLHAQQPLVARAKTTMLYGRIEQLTASAGAQFPTLKAQTAKSDPRGVQLKASAADNIYSGAIVRSFPTSFEGQYGGKLQLSMIQTAPLYAQVRAAEAAHESKLLRQGMEGKVNVSLSQNGSEVSLAPLQLYCEAPMSESRMGGPNGMDSIPGMGSLASMGAMGQMMKAMMANMPYVFVITLGKINGTGIGGQGVSADVVKETIHQLSPTVIEQDILATEQDSDPTTGRVTGRGYSESVVRVTKYDATRLFIQAASVDYNYDKRFLRKMLFQGYVTKGQVEQTMPMGGGGDIQKMLPPGFNPLNPGGGNGNNTGNPFQGLFGQ